MKRFTMRLVLAITSMLVSLAIIVSAHSTVYPLRSGGIKVVSWQAPAGDVAGYEYYFLQMESGRIFGRGEIAAPSTTVRFRTLGTYALWVRARSSSGEWGPWAQSTDPAFGYVNGEASPWLIRVIP